MSALSALSIPILEPLAQCLTPDSARAIARYRIDAETQALLDDFAARNTAGKLSPSERSEYEAYVNALDLLAILQSKARKNLK